MNSLIKEKKVELLLGSDLHQAYLLKDIRIGPPGESTGMHTALGWTIYGKDDGNQEVKDIPRVMVNFVQQMRPSRDSCNDILKILEQDFADLDVPQVTCMSLEDKHALQIMNKTVKKIGDHYSVGLLWKDDDPQLPNNREMAVKRLLSMKRKFIADPNLHQKYSQKMDDYIKNGYAIAVSDNAPSGANYIPHHCTSVTTKFRVVFDCSAKFRGLSLNDCLLQGPDLTTSLLGVLLRFRERPIAVIGDIKAMFSQVFVDEKDRDAYRFVWFPDGDISKSPHDYCMQTHVFGARCSPCCAAFALRKRAEDNLTGADEKTLIAVRNNIYVDDLCVSCDNIEEASRLIKQLCDLLKSGGFRLTKFLSNNSEVVSSIPLEDRAPDFNVKDAQLPRHKTLGVVWDVYEDKLKVRVNVVEKRCTRRGLLSVIGQTYDPLGVLQPFLLPARQLLQEACREGLEWDKELTTRPGLKVEWDRWCNVLPLLESVSLDRSFTVLGKKVTRYELHTFCDASTYGYGACSYLRVLYDDSEVRCCFVMGKSRVAPLKPVSVPRLELVAAVLAAKLSALIVREFQINLSAVYLWTDAVVVLRYLHNTSTRFETFVANHIELLHTLSSLNQWHYVPTKLNPADIASRGVWPDKVNAVNVWFKGPEFLFGNFSNWPKQPDFLVNWFERAPRSTEEGICSINLPSTTLDILHRLFSRYSDFHRLLRTVAWILRYIQYLKVKHLSGQTQIRSEWLSADDMESSRLSILKAVQRQMFPEVFPLLHNHADFDAPLNLVTEKQLQKSPPLRSLQSINPYLVNGILRVGGRLQCSSLSVQAKHPIVLPHSHPVTDLIIMMHHQKEGHMGCSQVLASINKKYWILKGRAAVRKVLQKCLTCRFWKVTTGRQQMADLPANRVTRSPPFMAIGTDLMGPLIIRVGRCQVKRYICIFNCLATRAVHFEVVQSLEANAFLQAYRRFCSRRNLKPKEVYSDNGGNFVAAEKELRCGIQNWNNKVLYDALLQEGATWHFNPPRSSHQGGFYERMFRTVRKLIRSLVAEATLDEFDLLTLVAEIERIIND